MSEVGGQKLEGSPRRGLLMWAVAIAGVSVVLTGYRIYFHNQALQIPLVRLLDGSASYPNDPFAATLPYYASTLWHVVAWLTRIAPLEPLLLALFIAERVLVVYAAGNLALVFAPKSRLAMITAMAFFASAPVPLIGGGTLVMPYFEQTGVAVAFLLMAMAAFYRQRPIPWAIWLGAAFECNSLYGVYAITYFTAAFLADADYRHEWRRWVKPVALFAMLALPAAALSMGAVRDGGVSTQLWLAATRSRVPHHVFPSTWPAIKFERFAILVALAGAGAILAPSRAHRRHAAVWMAVAGGWVLLALAAERVGSPSMLILQPARATDLWYAFGVVALVGAFLAGRMRRAVGVLALIPFVLFHPMSFRLFSATGLKTALAEYRLVGMPERSMRQVCDWAQAHTSADAVFLINPNWAEFRALAGRSAFVTWKDGSALLWRRTFARPWAERIHALGYDVTGGRLPGDRVNGILDRLYDSMTDRQAVRLASRYGIRYWVVRAERRSSLPVVYSNRCFKVLKCMQPTCR